MAYVIDWVVQRGDAVVCFRNEKGESVKIIEKPIFRKNVILIYPMPYDDYGNDANIELFPDVSKYINKFYGVRDIADINKQWEPGTIVMYGGNVIDIPMLRDKRLQRIYDIYNLGDTDCKPYVFLGIRCFSVLNIDYDEMFQNFVKGLGIVSEIIDMHKLSDKMISFPLNFGFKKLADWPRYCDAIQHFADFNPKYNVCLTPWDIHIKGDIMSMPAILVQIVPFEKTTQNVHFALKVENILHVDDNKATEMSREGWGSFSLWNYNKETGKYDEESCGRLVVKQNVNLRKPYSVVNIRSQKPPLDYIGLANTPKGLENDFYYFKEAFCRVIGWLTSNTSSGALEITISYDMLKEDQRNVDEYCDFIQRVSLKSKHKIRIVHSLGY